jgi:hypothetical protein
MFQKCSLRSLYLEPYARTTLEIRSETHISLHVKGSLLLFDCNTNWLSCSRVVACGQTDNIGCLVATFFAISLRERQNCPMEIQIFGYSNHATLRCYIWKLAFCIFYQPFVLYEVHIRNAYCGCLDRIFLCFSSKITAWIAIKFRNRIDTNGEFNLVSYRSSIILTLHEAQIELHWDSQRQLIAQNSVIWHKT